ncbi:MAG: hypothetical protein PUB19_04155 [Lachnospiraceae bacterium]|nr:hypothetical protein [Lachnospiraceae bacterium]
MEEIPHLRGFNLIPFYYSDATLQLASFHLREVIYNILVFIPAGFYFTALHGEKNPGMDVFITDLITNTLGGICGMLLFLLMGNIWESRRMSIMNGLGMGAELLGGGFLTLMFVVR